jgi:hypothetical protein
MTPDPVYDKLARFNPDATGLDPAEVLFRAGRASAKTPRVWKVAVAGLLLANAATAAALLFRQEKPPLPEVIPVTVVVPVIMPQTATSPPEAPSGPSPDSIGLLTRTFDPDIPPPPAGFAPPDRPVEILTAGSRGGID